MHLDTPVQREIREHAYHEVARHLPYYVTLDSEVEAPGIYAAEDPDDITGAHLGTVRELIDQAVNGIFRFHPVIEDDNATR